MTKVMIVTTGWFTISIKNSCSGRCIDLLLQMKYKSRIMKFFSPYCILHNSNKGLFSQPLSLIAHTYHCFFIFIENLN